LLSYRQSSLYILNKVSSHFNFLEFPQRPVLGPSLFSILITELCNVIKRCKYLLFADDFKTILATIPVDDCFLLQSDPEQHFSPFDQPKNIW
jgi:hypothetical protein